MKKPLIISFLIFAFLSLSALDPSEIHSIHAPFGLPSGTPVTNDLIFRQLYTVSTNDTTKFADWIAYRVTDYLNADVYEVGLNYKTDPVLDDDETLERGRGEDDYKDAYATHGYEKGHLIPRAAVEGSRYGDDQVNWLSVFAPQTTALNQGPWKKLEAAVQRYADETGKELFVFAGPYYSEDEPMPRLPEADERHTVPSGFWMVVYTYSYHFVAFMMPQTVKRSDSFWDYFTRIEKIEEVTGLDFFSPINDDVELIIEVSEDIDWFFSEE